MKYSPWFLQWVLSLHWLWHDHRGCCHVQPPISTGKIEGPIFLRCCCSSGCDIWVHWDKVQKRPISHFSHSRLVSREHPALPSEGTGADIFLPRNWAQFCSAYSIPLPHLKVQVRSKAPMDHLSHLLTAHSPRLKPWITQICVATCA